MVRIRSFAGGLLSSLWRHHKRWLGAGVVLASMALSLLYLYADQIEEHPKGCGQERLRIVRVARSIPAGTVLGVEHVTTDLVPVRYAAPGVLLERELKYYLGHPVAVDIEEGQALFARDFQLYPRSGPWRIKRGMRAYPLKVDGARAIAPVLKVDDRLEILFTEPTTGRSCSPLTGVEILQVDPESKQVVVSVTAAEARLIASLQSRGTVRPVVIAAGKVPERDVFESCEGFEGLEDLRAIRTERRAILEGRDDARGPKLW